MLGPFDPTAVSTGILTNLAYDILKYKSRSIDNTLVGRVLRWAGIEEPNFEERVRNTLSKALGIYFDEHPEYMLTDIENFFRNSSVARQLNDYILDRQPLDEKQLQQLFDQHLNNAHSATKILFQRRGLSSQHLINNFLQCYRRVLREQLSVPQIGILLDIIDQKDTVIHEIRASEDRLKQYVDTLLNTILSPTALQAAYNAGQQQLATAAASIADFIPIMVYWGEYHGRRKSMPMRYAEVSRKELKFLDLTSLTVEEFQQLLPVFEKKFRERMKNFCLDGKPRVGRGYRTYSNCPLPTPEDRLLFILVYLKNNPLQVMQGELFEMPQNKANQWIHTLLPVLLTTMRSLGDAPARSLEALAQQLGQHVVLDPSSSTSDAPHNLPDAPSSTSDGCETSIEQAKPEGVSPPLFAMTGQKGVSSAPKTKMNRKATIAARKSVTQ